MRQQDEELHVTAAKQFRAQSDQQLAVTYLTYLESEVELRGQRSEVGVAFIPGKSSLISSISSTMSYGTPASASSTLSCPGIRPATGWIPNLQGYSKHKPVSFSGGHSPGDIKQPRYTEGFEVIGSNRRGGGGKG